MTNDLRLEQLSDWIHQDWPNATIEVASADASFRRYFRVSNEGTSTIAMDAPPEKEDCTPFIDVTHRLLNANVHAPNIIRSDLKQGFLLLEDFGNTPYLDKLLENKNDNSVVDSLYGDAIKSLLNIQTANTDGLPLYDAEFLMLEMRLMPEWFLRTHLNIDMTKDQQTIIDNSLHNIVNQLTEQPQVFVHRDFHSRNLMVTTDDNPGVIDYQDAMLGPLTYDLVSLLRDCYIHWPNDRVEAWALDFKKILHETHTICNLNAISSDTFIKWFDFMGLQRHIKVLGIFARLNHRDGKANYLNDLPLTLHYMMTVANKYPETRPLFELFKQWDITEMIGKVDKY